MHASYLLDVCSMSAQYMLDRVNGVLMSQHVIKRSTKQNMLHCFPIFFGLMRGPCLVEHAEPADIHLWILVSAKTIPPVNTTKKIITKNIEISVPSCTRVRDRSDSSW